MMGDVIFMGKTDISSGESLTSLGSYVFSS